MIAIVSPLHDKVFRENKKGETRYNQSFRLFCSPLLALFHRKIEEGGGVGLVFQGEVPPLAVVGLEAVAYHLFAR